MFNEYDEYKLNNYPVEVKGVYWIESRIPARNKVRIEALSHFALGRQIRTSRNVKTQTAIIDTKPKTFIDYLKQALVIWQPTLNFGWLIPEMDKVTFNYETEIISTYQNILPINPINNLDYDINARIYRIVTCKTIPKVVDRLAWLEGEPCTKEDLDKARDEYMNVMDSARLMNFWR